MPTLFRNAALAATLSLIPAATFIPVSTEAEVQAAAATAPVPNLERRAAPVDDFGLASGNAQDSGLAPGQTAEDFDHWLRSAPEKRSELLAFRDYLAAERVEGVVPLWQLVRTSSSWRQCGAEPFEAPPADKWRHIVATLKFVRDRVVPAVGEVEALSAYRNSELNACSNGAPKSAHRHFFALDLTPVDAAVGRGDLIRSVCAAHARHGHAYEAGLGFYSGRRFHVDSRGFRKWGPNGRGATSPCVTQA